MLKKGLREVSSLFSLIDTLATPDCMSLVGCSRTHAHGPPVCLDVFSLVYLGTPTSPARVSEMGLFP